MAFYLLGTPLSRIYSPDQAVIDVSLIRLEIICTTYFLCGIMEVLVGLLRGMGQSLLPTTVSLLGACAFRVLWIYTVFAADKTLTTLYISYPISWLLTSFIHLVCFFIVYFYNKRKLLKAGMQEITG